MTNLEVPYTDEGLTALGVFMRIPPAAEVDKLMLTTQPPKAYPFINGFTDKLIAEMGSRISHEFLASSRPRNALAAGSRFFLGRLSLLCDKNLAVKPEVNQTLSQSPPSELARIALRFITQTSSDKGTKADGDIHLALSEAPHFSLKSPLQLEIFRRMEELHQNSDVSPLVAAMHGAQASAALLCETLKSASPPENF